MINFYFVEISYKKVNISFIMHARPESLEIAMKKGIIGVDSIFCLQKQFSFNKIQYF